MANSTIKRGGFSEFYNLPAVSNLDALDTLISSLPNNAYYMTVVLGGTGLIIGIKGSNVYQRQIRITYFDNTIMTRLKYNSTTWGNWTTV